MQPSQNTVALKANVSRSTVSRVFNNYDDIPSETKKRVLEVARELGYHPDSNMEARRLVSRQGGRIPIHQALGIVWSESVQPLGAISFFERILRGATNACWSSEFSLHLLNLQFPEERAIKALSQVDGVILPLAVNEWAEVARKLNKPVVTVMGDIQTAVNLTIDHARAVRLAFDHLYQSGHRMIGYVGPDHHIPIARERWQAYRRCLSRAGLPYREDFVFSRGAGHFSSIGGPAILHWKKSIRPTAVVSYNDETALGLVEAATSSGWHIPRDLSIIGIDDIPEAGISHPGLTTVSIGIESFGIHSVEILVKAVQEKKFSPEKILMPLKLIERGSVRKSTKTIS